MQNTLYSLIELQEIDIKLDKVAEERGDLPGKVEEYGNNIRQNQELLQIQSEKIKSLKTESKKLELELAASKEQLKKYEEQLYKVKTNKEYDAIANETENVKNKLNELENRILQTEETIESLAKSNEEIEKLLKQLNVDYEESNSELQQKISASSEEENILKQERDIVRQKLTMQQLNSYERIRQAKKGMAVASCNGGVCSGCYSFIPPQKVVEIRNMQKLYYCESCGRILVWDRNVEE